MSRSLGWVQHACLMVIREYEEAVKKGSQRGWLTTFNITAEVYQVKHDKSGRRWVTNAQHVAVKRALKSLQRQGHIIGFRDAGLARSIVDGRAELAHIWMSEEGLLRWLQKEDEIVRVALNPAFRDEVREKAGAIAARAKSMGMTVSWPPEVATEVAQLPTRMCSPGMGGQRRAKKV